MKLVNKAIFAIFFLFITLNMALVCAEDANLSVEQKAELCLENSRKSFIELKDAGFSVQRVNDSLKEAEALYSAQKVLKNNSKTTDFSLIIPYCTEIDQIKNVAFESKDELEALKKFYSESLEENMNTSSVDLIISEIEDEMKSERYEKVKPLIDKAYQEISNIKTSQTTLNLFYKTTSRTIKDFFYENKYYILGLIIALLVLFLIYRKTIKKLLITKKINNLEMRKKTLKGLISDTQRDYFQYGKIPQGLYNIRTKKFAELIRDIDRQIPLLREELVKLGWKIKK